jgi:hypothetical protein
MSVSSAAHVSDMPIPSAPACSETAPSQHARCVLLCLLQQRHNKLKHAALGNQPTRMCTTTSRHSCCCAPQHRISTAQAHVQVCVTTHKPALVEGSMGQDNDSDHVHTLQVQVSSQAAVVERCFTSSSAAQSITTCKCPPQCPAV